MGGCAEFSREVKALECLFLSEAGLEGVAEAPQSWVQISQRPFLLAVWPHVLTVMVMRTVPSSHVEL